MPTPSEKKIASKLLGTYPKDPIKKPADKLKTHPVEIGGAEIETATGAKGEVLPARTYKYPARGLHH